MKIEHIDLTFINLPLVRPEGWVWGRRSSYTVGLVELHTDVGRHGHRRGQRLHGTQPGSHPGDDGADGRSCSSATRRSRRSASSTAYSARGGTRSTARRRLVLGGLEMACWDAVGKHLGQPVSTFFGGALKSSFASMYYIQAQSDLDAMVEQARDAVGRGFGTIYFKVAIEEERDVELVRRVREAVGPGRRSASTPTRAGAQARPSASYGAWLPS